MEAKGYRSLRGVLTDISFLLRISSLALLIVYLYFSYRLVAYEQFLNERTAIFLFTVLRDIFVLLIIVLGMVFDFFSSYFFGVRVPYYLSLLTLIGFTNLPSSIIALLENPSNLLVWINQTLTNITSGFLAFLFLVTIIMSIGFVSRGNVENGFWIFFLTELTIYISYIFGFGRFNIRSILNITDFLASPLFLHAVVAITYIEFAMNIGYLSNYILPAKQKLMKDIKIITRFERLTPEEISVRIEKETRMGIREKLTPLASLFAMAEYVGPVVERKFNTAYLARLKNYYDFLKSKDPKITDKITGESLLIGLGPLTVRYIIISSLKIAVAILISLFLLYLPEIFSLGVLGSRIIDMGLIETYIIYSATGILLLFILSEYIREK